ncbi:hypothetical protein HID58_087157 [Brassica napus]|uniref:(rape) hypothetical protein n=1 Tax=Brassica napus TaxID=3708 RepID=A0A816J0P6_BRANA|nr:hypothetical protein HID58_087157 [Brassica napus]CAF1749341.1 unnamed protein product [Brassica napus]
MANPWATVRLSSVLSLSSCSSGDKRNLIPQDPPDLQAQLSQVQYPRLSPSLPSSNRSKVSVSSTDSASSLSSSPTGQKRSAADPTSTSETTVARSTVKSKFSLSTKP